jgi:UDPglucose 6-dehydrogenase
MHTVAVCGVGYVGLVTAACLARLGNDVVGCDTDLTKLRMLGEGRIPFHEPGLGEMVRASMREGRLRFTNSTKNALAGREIVFIAVGTPVGPLGEADLSYVRAAAKDIAMHGEANTLVVNKSTVPVETADLVSRILRRNGGSRRFMVASNPEFLREGTAIQDFLHPDRIVIGTDDERATALLRDLYAGINAPTLVVDAHTAEMIKYAANAFLATKLSFVNELSNISAAVGADIDAVICGIGFDHRIGNQYMQPGLGFGGSCLPKDVSALAHVARTHAIEPAMLDAALEVNKRQVARAVASIETHVAELDGAVCALLGLSFKPHTDDVRESPAIALARALCSRGVVLRAHDPAAMAAARTMLSGDVALESSPFAVLEGADFAVVATAWPEYRLLDWARVRGSMRSPIVFDLRNALDASHLRRLGFSYEGIARRPVMGISA